MQKTNARIYLDHSATTPVDKRVVDAMLPFFTEEFGNPSSIYGLGRSAKVAIEDAREKVASVIKAQPSEIVFTGGGSESDNMAIVGAVKSMSAKGKHIITTRTEHHAVLHTFESLEKSGYAVSYVPCDQFGYVSAETIAQAIRPDTVFISVIHINNEVGTINPIEEISALAKSHQILFHTDAVQSFGKIPFDVKNLPVDLLSVSAHKIYGPKGVGCLYIRRGVKIPSFIEGGSQERGQRAGTENVPGIVGFGKAAEICKDSMSGESERLNKLMTVFWKTLQDIAPQARLNGHPEKRLPGHFNISFPGIGGDEIAMMLDLEGISVSTGSACTSGAVSGSHVLKAMGLGPEFYGSAVRFTFGRLNSEQDIPSVMAALQRIVEKNKNASIL